jgi:hypothetical protein
MLVRSAPKKVEEAGLLFLRHDSGKGLDKTRRVSGAASGFALQVGSTVQHASPGVGKYGIRQ